MKKGGYNLRILYSSNAPWASSGYGVQGQSLLPRLAELPEIDGRDNIGIFAWYGLQGGIHNVSGFRVYPAGADAYGNDIIAAHTRDFQADVVISLIDVWVMHGTAEKVKPALWCVPGDTLITLNDGHQRAIKDLYEMQPNRHAMIGHDGTNQVDGLITGYHYMGVKPTLEIETATGRKLRTTAESGVYVKRNGDAKYIPAASVIPGDMVYCTAGYHTFIQEDNNEKSGARTHAGMAVSDRHQRNRTGVLSGDNRRRGDDQYSRSYQTAQNRSAQGRVVSNFAADGANIQYGLDSDRMVTSSDRLSLQRTGQAQGANELSSRSVGLSDVRHFDATVAVFDSQEAAGVVACGVHRDTGDAFGYGIQPAIRTARSRDMAGVSGNELEEVRSVRSTGIQEPVYDLTTSTHNFYANGILIHNCPWLPIDHDPVPQRVLDCLKGAHLPLTYSKWGHEMLTGAGVENHYIPHGVEPGVFRVLEDRDKVNEFRAAIFGPECKHLSVIVAANKGYPDRKAFQVQIRAWAAFAKDKPGAKLYIHTEPTPMYGGLDLPELCKSLGILDRVMFPDRYKNFLGMPADYMALIYNAADVYLGATMSEGFGIPIVEAQACGTPVIVTDFSAMPELVRWGYAIPPRDMFWTPQNAWQAWPDHEGITDALHSLYSSLLHNAGRPTLHDRLKTSAAIHNEYSWDVIVRDQWRPLMARMAEEVAGAKTEAATAQVTTGEKRKPGKVLKLVEPKEVYQNGQKEPVAA